MAVFVTLTPHPVTIGFAATGDAYQPLWTAVNISRYDILDLELGVFFLTPGVKATFYIETSMQNQIDATTSGQRDESWLIAGQFAAVVGGRRGELPKPQWQKLNIASGVSSQGLLKFIRWRVNFGDAGTTTFFIRGLARRWGR